MGYTEVVLSRCSPTEKHLRYSRQDKNMQQAKEINRQIGAIYKTIKKKSRITHLRQLKMVMQPSLKTRVRVTIKNIKGNSIP